jgi:hypothetical protein
MLESQHIVSIKSKNLKRLIRIQQKISEKAKKVMSSSPPSLILAQTIRAKYIKASKLVSLPPLKLIQKPLKTVSRTPILCNHQNPLKKPLEIGILQGLPKYFTIRRRSKSQEIYPSPAIHPKTIEDLIKETEIEFSPMTILVKFKENNK